MRQLLTRTILGLALVVTAVATSGHAPRTTGWEHTRASVYGDPSRWDCGYWKPGVGCTGYWEANTSHYWHCDARDSAWGVMRRGESVGVAHRTAPLGSWMEIQVPTPDGHGVTVILVRVADRGPYAPWAIDMQQPLVEKLGWSAKSWGLREVKYRLRPDMGRYCPAHGEGHHTQRPPFRALIPEG